MFGAANDRRLKLVLAGLMLAAAVPGVGYAGGGRVESAEQLFANGLDALADKQPGEARQFFEQVIRAYPASRASAAAERELARLNGGEGGAGVGPDVDGDDVAAPIAGAHPRAVRNNEAILALRRDFVTKVGDRVFFAENSATIGGRARSVIEAEARWLKSRPSVKVRIVGRADDGGSAANARDLSAKRAEAVRDKLIEAGFPADRLVIDARGETDPVATCRSALCQAENRNVEILIEPAGAGLAGVNDTATGHNIKGAAADPATARPLAR